MAGLDQGHQLRSRRLPPRRPGGNARGHDLTRTSPRSSACPRTPPSSRERPTAAPPSSPAARAQPGDGVTSLGTTLTLKLLSDKPVFAPDFGIYSHRIGEQWLAGGASNTGGAAIGKFFTAEDIARLTPLLDPDHPTGLDYYPLPRPGERFPVNDPNFQPRLEPRPDR